MSSLESFIERRAVQLILSRLGVTCIKVTPSGTTGWPDRLAIMPDGGVVWIEFKQPGAQPTPKQNYIHRMLRGLGHQVEVCDNALVAVKIIEDALRKSIARNDSDAAKKVRKR